MAQALQNKNHLQQLWKAKDMTAGPLTRTLHAMITWYRFWGSKIRTLSKNDDVIRQFSCKDPDDIFYIVGTGGSLCDLSDSDCSAIETGTSICINLAITANIAFDLVSLEYVPDSHILSAYASNATKHQKTAVFWFQKRKKYENAHLKEIRDNFTVHNYKRVSVSANRDLDIYKRAYRKIVRPATFQNPNFNISFANVGSIARVTLLGLGLGYRRICYVGIDLNENPYFWTTTPQPRNGKPFEDKTGYYNYAPRAGLRQAGKSVLNSVPKVPNFYDFLRILKTDIKTPAIELTTLDPKNRSDLTKFLDQKWGQQDKGNIG